MGRRWLGTRLMRRPDEGGNLRRVEAVGEEKGTGSQRLICCFSSRRVSFESNEDRETRNSHPGHRVGLIQQRESRSRYGSVVIAESC